MTPSLFTTPSTLFAVPILLLVSGNVQAQHSGDIGVDVVDGALLAFGPIGGEETNGVFYGEFGDTGFPGFTSNPGFDAEPGSLPPGRIGFEVLAGLRRWDPLLEDWLEPSEVGERLEISYITLSTLVEDEPIMGFDLAVQPDGGWHRHVNFELLDDGMSARAPGVYRLDLSLYSTMGIANSNTFTIAFNYEASAEEVDEALASLMEADDCIGDLDRNGVIDGADFGMLLAAFGSADPEADLDKSGDVSGSDIGLLLANWGSCPQ